VEARQVRRPRLAGIAGGLQAGSRRARVTAACAAIAVVALAVGIIVGTGPDASQGASPAAKASGATTVQRRDLVSTDTESGTLSYANPQTVFNRLSGTITSLPQIGQLVKPGQALYDVDNQPVTLLNGSTPAYRDLTSSDSDGPDILELNQDLKSMGFDPSNEITVNDSWQAGTTNAVEAWQNSLGQTETGTISLGEAVFLPGAQRITSISTVLGSTGGAGAASSSAGSSGSGTGSGSGSATGASYTGPAGGHLEFVGLTTTKVVRSTAAASEADARAAAVRTAWLQACSGHNLAKLANLKRTHPRLLHALLPSSCARKPANKTPQTGPTSAPAPTTVTTPGAGTTTATTTPGVTTPGATTPGATTPGAPATNPVSVPAAPSLLAPSWGADMAVTGSHPTAGGGSKGAGSGSGSSQSFGGGGSSSKEDATINRALKALLKAETLLLERSTASSRAGGSTAGGASSARGGASASSGGSGGGSAASGGSAISGGGASAGGSGSSGGSGSGSSGSGSGSSAQAILGTTSNQLTVIVDLDATKQSEAVVGEPVTVEMPDGSVVDGKITQVSPVAQSSSSSSGSGSGSGSSSGSGSGSSSTPSATIPVTIALHGRVPSSGLDQAAVSVNFQQQVANHVLSVPVTALLATQGGGYAVQEAAAPHRLLPVSPGLFAAGYVQVSSSQIYPGLQVTDSQG
jgi:hypothetical protein